MTYYSSLSPQRGGKGSGYLGGPGGASLRDGPRPTPDTPSTSGAPKPSRARPAADRTHSEKAIVNLFTGYGGGVRHAKVLQCVYWRARQETYIFDVMIYR